MRVIYLVFSILILKKIVVKSEYVTVQTEYGKLRGFTRLSFWKHSNIYSFLGVPYAKPPIGNRRFMVAEEISKWEGIKNATQYGNMCPQIEEYKEIDSYIGDEDCLNLNIYTPILPEINNNNYKRNSKNVIVYIHGGRFQTNSNQDPFAKGIDFMLDDDVIIVVPNYRLNVFGFLSTDDGYLPGNLGLKDQILALKWVNKNIKYFGGNPKSITLLGNSAGAMCVHLLHLTSKADDLFHKIILQSGHAFLPEQLTVDGASERAFSLANILGFKPQTTKELKEFLMNQTASALVIHSQFVHNRGFKPVVEMNNNIDSFLSVIPENLLISKNMKRVPMLCGINSAEGLAYMFNEINNNSYIKYLDEHFHVALPRRDLQIPVNSTLYQYSLSKIRRFYFGDKRITRKTLNHLDQLLTDSYFAYSARRSTIINFLHGEDKTFFYLFDHEGSFNVFKEIIPTKLKGCTHGDELCYVFKCDNANEKYLSLNSTSIDLKVMLRFARMWTNFAKTGIPTPRRDPLLENVIWKSVKKNAFNYMYIGSNLLLKQDIFKRRMKFWSRFFKNIKSKLDNLSEIK